jgi:hypothetical protein
MKNIFIVINVGLAGLPAVPSHLRTIREPGYCHEFGA